MKVLLVSVDGMRPDALPKVKNAQKLIARSANSMRAQTVIPSVTLPCHISLFHSVDPARHGTTTNTYTPPHSLLRAFAVILQKTKRNALFFITGKKYATFPAPPRSRTPASSAAQSWDTKRQTP